MTDGGGRLVHRRRVRASRGYRRPDDKIGPSGISFITGRSPAPIIGESEHGMVTTLHPSLSTYDKLSDGTQYTVMFLGEGMKERSLTLGTLSLFRGDAQTQVRTPTEGWQAYSGLIENVSAALGELGLPRSLGARFASFANRFFPTGLNEQTRQNENGIEGAITLETGEIVPVRLEQGQGFDGRSLQGLQILPTGPARKANPVQP